MSKVRVIEEAPILIPNKDHQNFTESGKLIPRGTIIEGEMVYINGLKKGKPFTYRLFKTKNKEFIFQKFLKPMEATEVKLGADAQVSPTKVDVPANKKADTYPYIGAGVGLVLGYGLAKYQKHTGKKMWLYIGGGTLLGFVIGQVIAKRKKVKVTPSK